MTIYRNEIPFLIAGAFPARCDCRSWAVAKLKVQAQHLEVGDIVGTGETILYVGQGVRTPKGCVDIVVQKGNKKRSSVWRKYTMIGVERKE